MAKFKCSNCGQAFDGDIATMQCPHCGSYEFKKIGGSIPWKIVGIIGGVVLALIILVALFTGEDKPVVSLQEKGQTLVIEVKNVKAPKLRNEYKMVVYDETNSIHQILRFNGKTSVIHYDVAYLLSGKCYNFSLERQDNKRIEELTWATNRQYCVPLPPVPPVIKSIQVGDPDHDRRVYKKVTIHMEEEGNFTYIIGGIKQGSPVFVDLKPGDYTVEVYNADGVHTSQNLHLRQIRILPPPLTLVQIQEVFDKVTRGTMSASVAVDSLANGNVNLTTAIQPGDIRTLWGALMEASMGEAFAVHEFQNNPSTNKIKSGSLKLSRK